VAELTSQMTVLSTIRNEDAWFGWNNISTTSTFQDVGPNDVSVTRELLRFILPTLSLETRGRSLTPQKPRAASYPMFVLKYARIRIC